MARSTVRPHSETTRGTPVRSQLRTFLRTSDGVTIDAVYDPGAVVYDASRTPAAHPVFVVAHGFTGAVDRPHVRRVARAFTRHGAVVTFSFRGHGASGGRSTVGDREVLDLAAAVRWARELGHARVGTVGFSMG
ncbi:alpha/beta hydrolase, partial [Streptomyces swartbergensis]